MLPSYEAVLQRLEAGRSCRRPRRWCFGGLRTRRVRTSEGQTRRTLERVHQVFKIRVWAKGFATDLCFASSNLGREVAQYVQISRPRQATWSQSLHSLIRSSWEAENHWILPENGHPNSGPQNHDFRGVEQLHTIQSLQFRNGEVWHLYKRNHAPQELEAKLREVLEAEAIETPRNCQEL